MRQRLTQSAAECCYAEQNGDIAANAGGPRAPGIEQPRADIDADRPQRQQHVRCPPRNCRVAKRTICSWTELSSRQDTPTSRREGSPDSTQPPRRPAAKANPEPADTTAEPRSYPGSPPTPGLVSCRASTTGPLVAVRTARPPAFQRKATFFAPGLWAFPNRSVERLRWSAERTAPRGIGDDYRHPVEERAATSARTRPRLRPRQPLSHCQRSLPH